MEIKDVMPDEITKQIRAKIQANTTLDFAKTYYQASEKYTNGNNALLMKVTLEFWEAFSSRFDSIEDDLRVIKERLDVPVQKKIRTNNGELTR